jgi:hypothetical protein
VEPYSSEPIERQAEKEQKLASLKDRLAGKESLSNW